MVLGALFAYYAPSNRGFVKITDKNEVDLYDSFLVQDEPNVDNVDYYAEFGTGNSQHNTTSAKNSSRQSGAKAASPMTALRRKPLRAMAVLTSIASDFDLVSDWLFFRQSLLKDREYREEFEANPTEGDLPFLIPRRLLICVFIFCILGTIMYLLITTEGRIVAPLMKRLGIDKISMGFMLFLSVLLEDVPQIVLTFLVEDYYEEGQFLSQLAVFNLMASLYDTCIKLAESYDQRHDVVETGIWCKKSIAGHDATITGIIVLPEGTAVPQAEQKPPAVETRNLSDSVVPRSRSSAQSLFEFSSSLTLPASFRTSFRMLSQKPLLVEAFFPEQEPIAPHIPFLTTSMDGTAKLWHITSDGQSLSSSTSTLPSQSQCLRMYSDPEAKGFTCLAWVGKPNAGVGTNHNFSSYFLTGCNNGSTKLWDLNGNFHKTYRLRADTNNPLNRVASIATATFRGRQIFACGHETGMVRLWEIWGDTSSCLYEIKGHDRRVTSITFVADDHQFVSASTDSTLKLWDTEVAFQRLKREPRIEVQVESSAGEQGSNHDDPRLTTACREKSFVHDVEWQDVPSKTFRGHTGPVLAVVCVDQKSAILSGSQDQTARLWSIESGLCLRVFRGHSGAVHSVLALDRVTFLSGSTEIKAWDALSGECLRTYEGHKNMVTGLSTVAVSKDETESATTFISSSVDKTIKVWVLTAVSYKDPAATLDHILDLHENTCRCFDPARSYGNQAHATSTRPLMMRACSPDHFAFDHPYYEEATVT